MTMVHDIHPPSAQKMTDLDLHRVLIEFNATKMDYPKDVCLHQLFEKQVLRTPDLVAVVYEGAQLTFYELNQRANQLAFHLQSLGVGPDVLVGVYMERSLEMVVALFGILKAGGAYVPLDPEYPPERLSFMIEDTRVQILLTQAHLSATLPPNEANVIRLDKDFSFDNNSITYNPTGEVSDENLAYVIFTSGSTGKPKGIMICHRAICNRIFWMQDAYQLNPADRILQKTPFSFDVSVWEFFWPLLFGARLIMARPGGQRDPNYLVNLIIDQGITTLHFVPSMLQLFLDDKNVGNCQSLKRVICSGETLSYELQERFFRLLSAELHNLYGPTEAAVDVTYWACQQGSSLGFVPIGRPVANTQLYVLGENMRPLPIGEPGELYIGGVQIARGYLNRPDLTAATFIPDPFSSESGARLYKTGDLASYLPTGDLKFLGRIDYQVKIRGNRIELGEIESVLEAHPSIKQAIVLAREDEPEEKRLVAYMVADSSKRPDIAQLRIYLRKKLPDYMLPSAYIVLDVMPLSPAGKVDRRALPKPGNTRPELELAYVAPRDSLESFLANIWCDILQLDCVGIYDRFFELGGTSLQAARFINKLQVELKENIYIVSIFENSTIAEYATFLKKDYLNTLQRRFDLNDIPENEPQISHHINHENERIDDKSITRMYECIPSLTRARQDTLDEKNPPAIFILSPPRSGTTLLRVMLAGHPDLFASSELQLLGFNTLRERKVAYSGKYSFWLEGTIRTIMEIKGCDADKATCIMEEYEQQDYTTQQFYRVLQDWIGDRILVDKSPSYVLDLNTLEKAECDFLNPVYIHLIRHPYAMVRSFESYHMDQVLFLKAQPFSPRQLGELVWFISHKNALQFLHQVPENRKYQMRFEDLVSQPQVVMEEMCRIIGLRYHPDLLKPYEKLESKMTNGVHKESKPMGDTKFLEHGKINPDVAESWKDIVNDNFLGDETREFASSLGYEMPGSHPMSQAIYPPEQKVSAARIQRELLEKRRLRRKQLRGL